MLATCAHRWIVTPGLAILTIMLHRKHMPDVLASLMSSRSSCEAMRNNAEIKKWTKMELVTRWTNR